MKFPRDIAVYLALGRVDLRWSFEALIGVARDRLRRDPRSGALFVFLNGRRTRAKVLFFDETGYCLLHKRLERGSFPVPTVVEHGSEQVEMTTEQLELLWRGLNVSGARRRGENDKARRRPSTFH